MREGKLIVWIATLLFAFACSPRPLPPPNGSPEPGGTVTLLVKNVGLAMMSVYSDISRTRLGSVMPGESECMLIRVLANQRLIARPMGGGQAVMSPPFRPVSGEGWYWSLGTAPVSDGLSLVRADRCSV